MKKILPAAAYCIFLIASGCKEAPESNMLYIEQMKDSIFKAYPTVASVTIEVNDDNKLAITVGDKHLFQKDDAKRQQTALEMGAMALRIFPKNSDLAKGELIISDDEKSVNIDKNAAKISAINIDSLRKSMK